MGSIRFNISKDSLITLNLTVYSETLASSFTMNAVLDTGAVRSIIPPKVASNCQNARKSFCFRRSVI